MAEKVFLKECYIQGTNQYEALDVWKYLDIGTPLHLKYKDEKIMLCLGEYIRVIKQEEVPANSENEVSISIKEALKTEECVGANSDQISISGTVTNSDENYEISKVAMDVNILLRKKKSEDYFNKKIGFLSEEDTKDLKAYMKANQEDIFDACISYKDKEGKADENKRLKVVIRIVKKESIQDSDIADSKSSK